MASLRLILLLENYGEDGLAVRKDGSARRLRLALHRGYNGLPGANIPYAKEIFWMSKYPLVISHARTMRSA